MLTKLVNFWNEKKRLLIEYALIAGVVITGALTYTMWIQREDAKAQLVDTQSRLAKVSTRLTQVETVNERQEKTITTLNQLREQDNHALNSLLKDYSMLTGKDARVRARVAELEKQNAQVKGYLDQPIPDDLKCVLENRTCSGAGASSGDRVR